MNVFTFSGNLGSDAELRTTPSGTEVATFSVAVRSGYGQNEATTWTRCAIFGKRASSLAPYLLKGKQVVISGEAALKEWTNREGVTKSSLEVRVNDITLVGDRQTGHAPQQQSPRQAAPAQDEPSFDDDIPF